MEIRAKLLTKIDRLNYSLGQANKEIESLQAELDKTRLSELNKEYIINELEKYIQENINSIYTYFDNTPYGVEETYKEVLNKLQELKGGDKE